MHEGALLFSFGKHNLHTRQPSRFSQETSIFYSPSPHSLLVSKCCISPNIWQISTLLFPPCYHNLFLALFSMYKPYDSESFHPHNNTAPPNVVSCWGRECSHLVLLSEWETDRETESAKRNKYWKEKFQFLIESLKGKGMYFVKSAGLIFLLRGAIYSVFFSEN